MPTIFLKRNQLTQAQCIVFFALLVSPVVFSIIGFIDHGSFLFAALLFFTGWFTWTFAEYCLHRFWNHSRSVDKNNRIVQRHHHHHTHPTEIKVTMTQRVIMMAICTVLVAASFLFSKWVMLLAGICTGVFWFFLMHYFLHQKWSAKVFPRLIRYHMTHHCKQPDTCFGISVSWWDLIFDTLPQRSTDISERIVAFYYKKEKKTNRRFSISAFIDEKLFHG